MSRQAKLVVVVVAALMVVGREASACAVCFTGDNHTLWAYYLTAILLTCLPLAMVGGASYWLIRRTKGMNDASK